MRTVGVVAEYNPFHPGHVYQLQEARRASGADCVIVVMSSCFTQRGDAAILSPSVRARMALNHGADIVFALPVCWAVRDAEHFALGAVYLLQLAGADAISFGAEIPDASLLTEAARLLEQPDALSATIGQYLSAGLPYPAALSAAAGQTAAGLQALFSSPNNTLAVCYLRTMLRLGYHMDVYPVARTGDYHATAIESMPSATALRGAIHRGDWNALQSALPEDVFQLLQEEARSGRIHRVDALDQALLYRLRTMTDSDWRCLPNLSEGIDDRLRKSAVNAVSRESLLQSAKTRRYPYARLSRLCTHAMLGITESQLRDDPLPSSLWLLGLRESARPLLSSLKQRGVSVISKVSAYESDAPWFQTEIQAYDLWTLGCGQPSGLAMQQGVVRL